MVPIELKVGIKMRQNKNRIEVRQFVDGADPGLEIRTEWAALPSMSKTEKTPPLRPVTTPPLGRPGSELNTTRASARAALDHGAALRAADLLVAGEQAEQRPGRAAELLEGGQHEHVHHQPRLHVGDAGAGGDAALDAEGPAARLALGEHRVAVPIEDDRSRRALPRRAVLAGDAWPSGSRRASRAGRPRPGCRAAP